MMVSDKEYQTHAVFSELERYSAFYRDLAGSVLGFVSLGTGAICNIDSHLFRSVEGTMTSIRTILRDGRINDAYSLLRKYYDSAIINVYTNLYLQDHFSIENFVVEQIDNWLRGKKKLPEYRIMSQYIRTSSRVAPIAALVSTDDRYKRLRDRCNDHTHYNFYATVFLNDNRTGLPERRRALEEFSNDLRDVLILHVAYMFFANGHYMMADDYLDCLDCGMAPEPESQYRVAPFVQDIFDQTVKKLRPDIVASIRQHTCMHLA
jgi:hypothetical protein